MCLRIHKGKVLRCFVSTKSIKANPDKIKALIEMQDPVLVKDVQKLTGRVAALNGIIPRAAKRSLHFSEARRTFNGPKLRNKLFKNSRTTCRI
jgi:hypothetical protein